MERSVAELLGSVVLVLLGSVLVYLRRRRVGEEDLVLDDDINLEPDSGCTIVEEVQRGVDRTIHTVTEVERELEDVVYVDKEQY